MCVDKNTDIFSKTLYIRTSISHVGGKEDEIQMQRMRSRLHHQSPCRVHTRAVPRERRQHPVLVQGQREAP